ncbi:hypothetical protein ACFQV2_03245 [Actinokineospora soli]|uniref:Uncharacterized protein n=1 Tax=Actinokineospora soli TaxID=1048753 RepID=A0ABW2TGC0_9PSEU
MAMYLAYGGALRQEIEQTITRTDDAKLSGSWPPSRPTSAAASPRRSSGATSRTPSRCR